MADFPYNQSDPLALCEGETLKANLALRDYALLGPGRSLDALRAANLRRAQAGYEAGTTRKSTLADWSVKFAWQERVARYEAAITKQLQAQDLDERTKERQERIKTMRAMRLKGLQGLAQLNPEDLPPSEIRQYLIQSNGELRADHDDEPEQRFTVAGLVETMSDDKLLQLAALLGLGGATPGAGGGATDDPEPEER